MKDTRLDGLAAEAMLVSLLSNYKGSSDGKAAEGPLHAVLFDTIGFDIIVRDTSKEYFPSGVGFLQTKLRMGYVNKFETQGHYPQTINSIKDVAKKLEIPIDACYFCVAFAKSGDVRTSQFFIFPLNFLDRQFKHEKNTQYRFSQQKCLDVWEKEMRRDICNGRKIADCLFLVMSDC